MLRVGWQHHHSFSDVVAGSLAGTRASHLSRLRRLQPPFFDCVQFCTFLPTSLCCCLRLSTWYDYVVLSSSSFLKKWHLPYSVEFVRQKSGANMCQWQILTCVAGSDLRCGQWLGIPVIKFHSSVVYPPDYGHLDRINTQKFSLTEKPNIKKL
jgi:hypothetical protein